MTQHAEQPIKIIKAGGTRASIWRNTRIQGGRTVIRHSVRISKNYRDPQTGEWKETEYYFANDLPHLVLVAQRAFAFISLRENEDESNVQSVAS